MAIDVSRLKGKPVYELAASNNPIPNNIANIQSSRAPQSAGKPLISSNFSRGLSDDVDDVYIVMIDEDMTIEDFAKQAYQSIDKPVIDHILATNPHLQRSFHQIVPGMPMVVSPHKFKHYYEKQALAMADELMTEFLTLSEEQRTWYGQNSELLNHTHLMLSQIEASNAQSNTDLALDENHAIAAMTGGIAGYQVINDAFNNRLQKFTAFIESANKELQHVPKSQLKAHPTYKAYRKELKLLQSDLSNLLKKYGKPSYFKDIQVNKINSLLNSSNKQLFRTADFSETYKAINAAKIFKQSISISKIASFAGNTAFLVGARANIKDVWSKCDSNDISMECSRSIVKNGVSMIINYQVGAMITDFSIRLAPVSYGLSLTVGIGLNAVWGYYGGGITDNIGDKAEKLIFDVVINNITESIDSIKEAIQ